MSMKFTGFVLLCASALVCRAQVIVGFDTTRGGTYNLQAQTSLQNAITAALPSATFSYTGALSGGSLAGAAGVVIVSPYDNIIPISPLSAGEQTALVNFVQSGGFAIVVTDADYTTAFELTDASFVEPFGLQSQAVESAPITITNPTGNPISNGPFGLINSLSGIATGRYTSLPGIFNTLGRNAQGHEAAGYFNLGALNAGSGAVLFIADGNAVNSTWASANNYKFISNFVAFAAIPEPEVDALLAVGAMGLGLVWRIRRKRTAAPARR